MMFNEIDMLIDSLELTSEVFDGHIKVYEDGFTEFILKSPPVTLNIHMGTAFRNYNISPYEIFKEYGIENISPYIFLEPKKVLFDFQKSVIGQYSKEYFSVLNSINNRGKLGSIGNNRCFEDISGVVKEFFFLE